MDRSLDEISSKGRNNSSGSGSRRNTRGGVRKPRDNTRSSTGGNYDDSKVWAHDKYNDEDTPRRSIPRGRDTHRSSDNTPSARLRVTNLHYDLGEDELLGLFRRIGPVTSLKLHYDRAGRSEGTAYVTYTHVADAQRAIDEFDGANAHGQPITLTLLGPNGGRGGEDGAKARSLFDRIRTASPPDAKRDPTRKPTPPGIDRYVPPERRRAVKEDEEGEEEEVRPRERGGRRNGGRREGGRGMRSSSAPGRSGRDRRGEERGGRSGNGGSVRPKKTVEELDAEMNDYFGAANEEPVAAGATGATAPAAAGGDAMDLDDDML